MIESTTFDFGEQKRVRILVQSFNKVPFEVTKATYKLTCDNEEEASGNCEITQEDNDRVILSALINPMRKNALYTLEYDYEIPPEKLIHFVQVKSC